MITEHTSINTIGLRGVAHADTLDTRRDVAAVIAQSSDVDLREITPASALTIAAWYQSPGRIGSVLASFASGANVSRTELLDDIAATRRSDGYHNGTMSPANCAALDCLSTFVINHTPKGSNP